MSLTRMLAAGALFVVGAVLVSVPACIVANDLENGQDCLRDQECSSRQCTAGKCIAQNGGVPAVVVDSGGPKTDSAVATDSATDGSETATDAPTDAPTETATDAGTDTEDAAVPTDTADGATSG